MVPCLLIQATVAPGICPGTTHRDAQGAAAVRSSGPDQKIRHSLRLTRLAVDAVLAEQGTEPLNLPAELLALLGQDRQGRVPGGLLFPARGLAGQQFFLPVT